MSVKEFVLTHNFKDLSELEEDDYLWSDTEEHFGVKWFIEIARKGDGCGFFLDCKPSKQTQKWSIDTKFEMRIATSDGDALTRIIHFCFKDDNEHNCYGEDSLVKWKDMMQEYADDDKITVQIYVKILNMTGIEKKKKLRNFDEGIKELSDVVLVVEDQKFYVSKLFLAIQSSYFKSLLVGKFKESKMQEIKLKDIDPNDFQNFLEVLYGDPAIDDDTVNGILNLADMYDAETVTRRCEEFLIKESVKKLKEKLDLSTTYKLENLKNNCLLKINTVDEIKSVLPENLIEMDHSVATALLQKIISLH